MLLVTAASRAYTMLKNRFNRDEEGASMVEYALLVALIAIVCIVALTGLGQSISNLFATTCNHLSSVNAAASGSAQSASC